MSEWKMEFYRRGLSDFASEEDWKSELHAQQYRILARSIGSSSTHPNVISYIGNPSTMYRYVMDCPNVMKEDIYAVYEKDVDDDYERITHVFGYKEWMFLNSRGTISIEPKARYRRNDEVYEYEYGVPSGGYFKLRFIMRTI